MAELSSNLLAFAEVLRSQFGVEAGHAQAYDALRALEATGVRDPARARYALRSVFCSKREELAPFNRAFDAFFLQAGDPRFAHALHRPEAPPRDAPGNGALRRRDPEAKETQAQAWAAMRARYSPAAGRISQAPALPAARLAQTFTNAERLIAALRLGRSRRWKPRDRGRRFDLRRTLRASLQTGAEPVRLHALGHPPRNPRVVLLVDGSRSMTEHAPELLQFGYALCRRSPRASVFVFSTELREITRQLRVSGPERKLGPLGEAWGAGTRIGASLSTFVRECGSRLNADTLTIVASDGLDVGDLAELRDAMRAIHRRCAGIIWLNPHAGRLAFEPAARGMQTALPYISALVDAKNFHALHAAARRLGR